MTSFASTTPPVPARGKRLNAGLAFLMLAVVSPFLTPLVLFAGLPRETAAAISGLLLFGIPMALLVGAIAIMGQPGFRYLKGRAAGSAEPFAPAPSVSAVRYRVGLALFIVPILVSWLEPVLGRRIPELMTYRVLIGALFDAMLMIGVFVLGGAFWDKFHALFRHDAKVVADPAKAASGAAAAGEPVQVGTRFYLGAAIFVAAFAAWGLVPLASAAGWSTGEVASLSGGIFVANKLGLLGAIAVMGKPGFNHLKGLMFKLLRRVGPPERVSRSRYRLGLVLFLVPLLLTWLQPYERGLLGESGLYAVLQELPGGVLLLVSLFVLGGEFWDKLRALFVYRAKVQIPAEPAAAGA